MNYYIDFDYYTTLYDDIDEATFNRLIYDACAKVDNMTTGLSGLRRLEKFFPENERDVEAVKRCVAKVLNLSYQIEKAESNVQGNVETEGEYKGKVIESISSGSEKISFVTNKEYTVVSAVVSNKDAQDRLYNEIIVESLRGIKDARGVNLLYMGW